MNYVKPQSPIRKGNTGIYPLTTYDQIIMKDGTRFNGENFGSDGGSSASIFLYSATFLAQDWQGEGPYSQTVKIFSENGGAGLSSENDIVSGIMIKDNLPMDDNYNKIIFGAYLINQGEKIISSSLMTCKTKESIKPEVDITIYFYAKKDKNEETVEENKFVFEMPIGYIFDWAPVEGNNLDLSTPDKVANYFGYGVWKELNGVFTFGRKDGYEIGSSGGEEKHTLTIDEMPSHRHNHQGFRNVGDGSKKVMAETIISSDPVYTSSITNTGGNQPHNNMPPYLVVYKWQRIG